MQKALNNYRNNRLHLRFANGNSISVIWDWGSYSDNHMKLDGWGSPDFRDPSNTCEIMLLTDPSKKTGKKIAKMLGNDTKNDLAGPYGRITIEELVTVLDLLANDKKV